MKQEQNLQLSRSSRAVRGLGSLASNGDTFGEGVQCFGVWVLVRALGFVNLCLASVDDKGREDSERKEPANAHVRKYRTRHILAVGEPALWLRA